MTAAADIATTILLLVARPECGHVQADRQDQLAQHLVKTALRESGGDPLVIGVNAEPMRGLPAGQVRSHSVAEAVAAAQRLWAQHRRIDLGLFQISDANLGRHHLTVAEAFDACHNAAAAAEHLADDYRAAEVWLLAHRRYNCGGFDCGIAYAHAIMSGTPPVRAGPPPPSPSPCAPILWDAWAYAACTANQGKKP